MRDAGETGFFLTPSDDVVGRSQPSTEQDKCSRVIAEEGDPDCVQVEGIRNQSAEQKQGHENRDAEAVARKVMGLSRRKLEICSVFDLRRLLDIVGIIFRYCHTVCALPWSFEERFSICLASTTAILGVGIRYYVSSFYLQDFAVIKVLTGRCSDM
jgi:hypothetical protein